LPSPQVCRAVYKPASSLAMTALLGGVTVRVVSYRRGARRGSYAES
jgi:hypothetical protein